MKKTPIILLLLLCQAPLWAQTDSLSAPVVADTAYSEEEYTAPNINPIYYFGSPFCEHFAEFKFYTGIGDFGVGINYTYLPEVWGGHVTGYALNTLWVMAGPDYRISRPWNEFDKHVYGSVGVFYDGDYNIWHPALEIGLRVGTISDYGSFCLYSGSVGVMTNFDGVYVTLGASFALSAIFSALILLCQE